VKNIFLAVNSAREKNHRLMVRRKEEEGHIGEEGGKGNSEKKVEKVNTGR
jgi:hypothetical protein